MNRESRNLDKLRSKRHAAINKKRKKFGNPHRANAMVAFKIDDFARQDEFAAQRFAREMEALHLANKMMGEEFIFNRDSVDDHGEEVSTQEG